VPTGQTKTAPGNPHEAAFVIESRLLVSDISCRADNSSPILRRGNSGIGNPRKTCRFPSSRWDRWRCTASYGKRTPPRPSRATPAFASPPSADSLSLSSRYRPRNRPHDHSSHPSPAKGESATSAVTCDVSSASRQSFPAQIARFGLIGSFPSAIASEKRIYRDSAASMSALVCWRQLRTETAVAAAPVHSRTPSGRNRTPNSVPMRLRDSVSRVVLIKLRLRHFGSRIALLSI
jgi:hypothetical protein